MNGPLTSSVEAHDLEEVTLVARGIATAVAPETASPTSRRSCSRRSPAPSPGIDVDYRDLEPLGARRAGRGAGRPRPRLPPAHRAPHGARRAGAAADPGRGRAPRREVRRGARRGGRLRARRPPLRAGRVRPRLDGPRSAAASSTTCSDADGASAADRAAHRRAVRAGRGRPRARGAVACVRASCPHGTLGHAVWEMYDGRGLRAARDRRRRADVPRAARLRARARRLRHQPQGRARGVRVHRAGRSRPEGLRVARDADRPVRDRLHRRAPASSTATCGSARSRRRACTSASPTRIRRGKVVCERYGMDLFDVDYYELATAPVDEVREMLGVPPKSRGALGGGFGRRLRPRRHVGDAAAATSRNAGEASGEPELHARRSRCAAHDPEMRSSSCSRQWDRDQAHGRHHGLHGHPHPRRPREARQYLIVADFGVVDPDVSAADEAKRNNERPETQAWAARLRELIDGEPGLPPLRRALPHRG